MFLKQVADEMKWTTWKTDLAQWLTNLVPVKMFFSALNSHALGRLRHMC